MLFSTTFSFRLCGHPSKYWRQALLRLMFSTIFLKTTFKKILIPKISLNPISNSVYFSYNHKCLIYASIKKLITLNRFCLSSQTSPKVKKKNLCRSNYYFFKSSLVYCQITVPMKTLPLIFRLVFSLRINEYLHTCTVSRIYFLLLCSHSFRFVPSGKSPGGRVRVRGGGAQRLRRLRR